MGVDKIIYQKATYNFFQALIASQKWFNPTPLAPRVLSQSIMENFVLSPVALPTQIEQTELKNVQLRTDLITYVALKNNDYVQFNSNGLRSGTFVPGRALLRLL